MTERKYIGPLHEMACTTITDLWNDSCSIEELTFSVAHGAVGATTNPSIVVYVLNKEMHLWKDRIRQIAEENPAFTDDEVAIQLNKEMAVKGSEILRPVYDREKGRKGRISIQTMAKYYRDTKRLIAQAKEFAALAPNMQVKLPVTKAGIPAIEEATYEGISINATVSFTVPQCIAVAEAVERGLRRREAEGKDISTMSPVCTVMCGRLDDWLKIVAEKEDIIVDPACLEWAGVAAMKRAYEIYQERGYRLRLLSAAYRNHMHWSEFIGGDVVVSIPFKWQERYNGSDVPCVDRIHNPVPKAYMDELTNKFVDFRRAYEEDGMTPEEFDTYGATVRTLRGFIEAYEQLVGIVRNIMLPNPDK
ncbi:MAG TPA: transaldolase family protein [Candidatus Hydrogenedentes bacterium]|nr:transaldolase family protein [Candidatus Hydrogenedentota bacterium]HOV75907.1 transaldolase family protein [Candidatus Hydrogenedentota bacterium]HPC18433.1 transaldolase family protein [Candidatus Hydrogenedentota bacterium]HRT19482.1 transaldolase family protein [Candidatus Hydrogenedentota bacterium]HRT66939.1 transaldolase family protein [Candidatus Hydrogenedentota bacterium]